LVSGTGAPLASITRPLTGAPLRSLIVCGLVGPAIAANWNARA
jgi:hypothetical protein